MLLEYFSAAGPGHAAAAPRRAKIAAFRLRSPVFRIFVPRNRIADFSKFAGTKMKETGIRISIQGHAGDGNMHIQLMRDDMDKKLFGERCPKLMEELYAQAKIMGGQVSGEHGIGPARVGALETFIGHKMIALYQAHKNAFDEKHILNPGKVIR